MKTQVLVFSKFTPQAKARLAATPHLNVIEFSSEEELKKEIESTEILLIRSSISIHKKLLERASQLKLIVTATSGFNHIDLKTCQEKNILVSYTPQANAQSAAELSFCHILNTLKKFPQAQKSLLKNQWRAPHLLGSEAYNKTLGIVGLGRIGKKLSHMAQAFGMKVLAYDPFLTEEEFQKSNTQRTGFLELIRSSDILSFHVPLTQETFEMLNAKTLSAASENLIVINASRGKVIREPDLIEFLKQKKIKAAALDVFHKEPLEKHSELLKLDNVILTPHMGAFTEEALQRSSLEAVEKVFLFLSNKNIKETLPPRTNWAHLLL